MTQLGFYFGSFWHGAALHVALIESDSFTIAHLRAFPHHLAIMAYVAPIHKATSIRHALRIRLLDPEIEDLVVA